MLVVFWDVFIGLFLFLVLEDFEVDVEFLIDVFGDGSGLVVLRKFFKLFINVRVSIVGYDIWV